MEWTCPSYARRLKFSSRRKLQLEVLRLPITAGYAYALVRHEWWMALGVFALMIPLARLDEVVRVEGRGPAGAKFDG